MTRVLDGYGVSVPRTVLPTGIDLRAFAGSDGTVFRARHQIEPRRPVIATVGRLARDDAGAWSVPALMGRMEALYCSLARSAPRAQCSAQQAANTSCARTPPSVEAESVNWPP